MFLFATTALAGVLIGWPCQRLNWGWRNVWSTCSIHSWAPTQSSPETVAQIPTGFRTFTASTTGPVNTWAPTNTISASGWYLPGAAAPIQSFFCNNAQATGSGTTSALRNRCRRAVDAYGSLVRLCTSPAAAVPAGLRGPNLLNPLATASSGIFDSAPVANHAPHVSNVFFLGQAAAMCVLPSGTPLAPGNIGTPATVCPGLLGWFTVVYNACGFTNAPALAPSNVPNAVPVGTAPNFNPNIAVYFPSGSGVNLAQLLPQAPGVTLTQGTRVGVFCASPNQAPAGTPDTTLIPSTWNVAGPAFRTSRCRRALDQFGRTAQRCHISVAGQTGPAQAGGYSDPLRVLAIGTAGAATPAGPSGLNVLAPLCN